MPRPRNDQPYVCGPYKHRAKWRILIYTPRGDGGRNRRIRSFKTIEEARTWTKGYEIVRAAAGRTLGDAVTEYIAHLTEKGNKSGSIATAQYRLEAILDLTRPLIDLTPPRAQTFYDELVADGGAVDTHHGCLVAAKAFGNFLAHPKRKLLRANPFAHVEKVGKKSRGKAQLTVDESRTFLDHCAAVWKSDRDSSAIAALFALGMGLRASEVAQLQARDVDDNARILHVATLASDDASEAKTAAGRRIVRVPVGLRDMLRELAEGAPGDRPLFINRRGKPADRHWVLRHAKRLMKAAGVRVVTAHGLRGTFATMDTLTRGDRRATSQAMGHTGTGMTERHYLDAQTVSDDSIDRVSDMLTDDDSD